MSDLPRVLTIMGSGETAPTMVRVHRLVLERLAPQPADAVMLDTPFGFQENAGEIAARAVAYFKESLNTAIEVASGSTAQERGGNGAGGSGRRGDGLRGSEGAFAEERLVSRIRSARYVFAGPGSPSYALRKWQGTVVPQLLGEKLAHGGAVTFASAAALTLGVSTVPVYEIYKVGEDPHWLEGLDLLSATGLRAAVIPHYNNAEGGTHDTRYCYLGESRLSRMEAVLPEGAFVLGIDEHTAVIFDLEAGSASVLGNGLLTVRNSGRSATFDSGAVIPIAEIAATAERLAAGAAAIGSVAGNIACSDAGRGARSGGQVLLDGPAATTTGTFATAPSPLLDIVRQEEARFSAAISRGDMADAVDAILSVEKQIIDWCTDIPAGDALDRARASLRSMIVELGQLAEIGAGGPREIVRPFVEALLDVRRNARDEKRYDESDLVRETLVALGVEVRDSPSGTEWSVA